MKLRIFLLFSLGFFLFVFMVWFLFLNSETNQLFLRKPRAESQNCLLRDHGDANCDKIIDLNDFDVWSKQYSGGVKCTTADFNNDEKCDIVDYGLWHKGYTGGE